MTTLIIRWDSSDMSAMGHAVSTCTSSKYRKKSPSEVRRDVHRAQTFYENTRKRNTEQSVQQQNTETDQMCELLHSPARSLTDDEDRRHADMGDSLTDEESQGSECRSCSADCSQGQTVDTRLTDPDMNSFHDTTLPETSEEEAALIRAAWEDRPVRPYLNSLDASARNAIVAATRSSKPVVNKVVLGYRYMNHSLVAETKEAVFVYDEARDKVTRWLVKESALQMDSYWVGLCDRVRRWPELNPLRHSAEINRLKLHVQACYSVIAQLWDGEETGGRGELV